VRAVRAEGYPAPTPIQERAIPHVLAGKDVLGCAQTGTGKTAAFALPILQRLAALHPARAEHHGARPIRVLVLSPTRELASQIGDSFGAYGRHVGFRHAVVFGGVGQDAQTRALRRGIDILVATPGRLLDLMGQGFVRFEGLEVLVLDEADRMLDMGFIHDVRRVIAALPRKRQTLLFSATMPRDIEDLARSILSAPVRVEVTPQATTVDSVDQSVYFVETQKKRALLEELLRDPRVTRALVFTRTKHGANRLARLLERASLRAEVIHGNKSQNARERALEGFKTGQTRVLVATDIAARGIDVEGISHVINYDLPNVPESYVHRIGRTARAGASGIAISLCDGEERAYLHDIEKLIRRQIRVNREHPYAAGDAGPPFAPPTSPPARSPAAPAAPPPQAPAARGAADVIAEGLRNAQRRRGRWKRHAR
jgi:ATP-dependent RNA helicase RhlE